METIRWGILSTAKIGTEKVIPAIQQAKNCRVTAIASRSIDKAREAADRLDIRQAFGSYEELLNNDDTDAIYNPLPNHMHVPWSIEAMEAGKHVLCEKPIGLSVDEAKKLQARADQHPDLKIMEAFMYRFHPQWEKALELVQNNTLGELQTIQSFFAYYNVDPHNIRNISDMGGGGLMDIGCYCISLARFLCESEPQSISANMKFDPDFDVDYLASGILDFGDVTATFTCSTQTAPDQRVHIIGTKGHATIEIPFNAPPDRETKIDIFQNGESETLGFGPVDQYTLQAEAFTNAILNETEVPTPLEDAINNMRVIEAVKESARLGKKIEL